MYLYFLYFAKNIKRLLISVAVYLYNCHNVLIDAIKGTKYFCSFISQLHKYIEHKTNTKKNILTE